MSILPKFRNCAIITIVSVLLTKLKSEPYQKFSKTVAY